MYKVLVKGDWAKEDAIKSEVKGCAKVPAWIWEKNGDDGWMAAFDLYGSCDESCVSKPLRVPPRVPSVIFLARSMTMGTRSSSLDWSQSLAAITDMRTDGLMSALVFG